jgi:hypothetical protein
MRTLYPASGVAILFLGLSATFCAGQGPGQFRAPNQIVIDRVVQAGCPVAITASQHSITRQFETSGARGMLSVSPNRPSQGLTVTAANLQPLRIVSAEVVAHALSAKSRAILTTDRIEADVTRSFHLVAKEDGGFSSDLWMDGVTSIRWIEVKSLTYSDDSVWQASERQPCTVTPNPMVLVSALR